MGDTFEQDEYYMEFMVFMKPWGASWDKEIADGYNLLPPAMDNYNDLIAEGEMPPVGEAPIGYLGAGRRGRGPRRKYHRDSGAERRPRRGL